MDVTGSGNNYLTLDKPADWVAAITNLMAIVTKANETYKTIIIQYMSPEKGTHRQEIYRKRKPNRALQEQ